MTIEPRPARPAGDSFGNEHNLSLKMRPATGPRTWFLAFLREGRLQPIDENKWFGEDCC